MKIKGMQLPPGMGLSEFLKKAKEGMQDDIYGALANPIIQSEDMIPERIALLERLNNNLGFDTMPESALTQTDIRRAIDAATFGSLEGNLNAKASFNDLIGKYEDPTLQALNNMRDEGIAFHIPMWQTSQNEYFDPQFDLSLILNKVFPSDVSPYGYNDEAKWIENNDTGEITSELGYLSPNNDEPPAVASAELFNSLSDEDLLKLLLKNKA